VKRGVPESILRKFVNFRNKLPGLIVRLRRAWNKNRTSSPFISGDAIAELVDYAPFGKNGEVEHVDLERLSLAKSIFIPAHLLSNFTEMYGGYVNASTLVTGNSDENFISLPNLPESVQVWIGQNIAIGSKSVGKIELHTLPIGLENLALGRSGIPRYFKVSSPEIRNRVFVPPMSPTNPIRKNVLEDIKTTSGSFDVYTEYLLPKNYFTLANRYRFVLCLEGNGFENHRVWETLYRNGFPVMFRSTWSLSLQPLNLPIFYIDNLDDCSIEALTEFELRNQHFLAQGKASLWTSYWSKLISGGKGSDLG
jgi:hypothetical protein